MLPVKASTGDASALLVAGKCQAVTHVVGRVVRDAHGREADGEQDDQAENECRNTLRKH